MSRSETKTGISLIWRYVVVGALLLPAVALCAKNGFGLNDGKVVVSSSQLPDQAGEWTGRDVPLSEDELSLLQSPASAQKVYSNSATEHVQILLLQVNNTQNAHDPRICMRGSGYELTSVEEVEAPWIGKSGKPYVVSRAVFQKEEIRVVMYYWIQTPDGTIPDMSAGLKMTGILRAMKGQATKGIAVRIICLPDSDVVATRPESGQKLWSEINQTLDIEGLVAGM